MNKKLSSLLVTTAIGGLALAGLGANAASATGEIDMTYTNGPYSHTYDLDYSCALDQTVLFSGTGVESHDSNIETVTGGVIDTANNTWTYTTTYANGTYTYTGGGTI